MTPSPAFVKDNDHAIRNLAQKLMWEANDLYAAKKSIDEYIEEAAKMFEEKKGEAS